MRGVRVIFVDMDYIDLNILKLPSEKQQLHRAASAASPGTFKVFAWRHGTARKIHTESRRETMPWERFDVKRTRPRLALACVEPMLPTHEVNEARVGGHFCTLMYLGT